MLRATSVALRSTVSLFALLLSACGTVYVNESDRDLGGASRSTVTLEASVDGAYRSVYGRWQECLSNYGYRVRGSINRERDAANVTVDRGLGFERLLYLADSIFLQAELARVAPERTQVTFIVPNAGAQPFVDATKQWLVAGTGPCRA